jgi:hypothetical protein
MTPIILLAVIAGVPVLYALLFRVNAIFLFLSVVTGDLLVRYLSDDVSLALATMVRNDKTTLITQFMLLLLPVAAALLWLRKTTPATKLLLHIPALLLTGLSLAVFTLPILDNGIKTQIVSDPIGHALNSGQDIIIGVSSISVLILAFISYKHREGKHGKRHK